MVRTSRCFVGISFQLGGPNALRSRERFLRSLHLADFFFTYWQLCFAAQSLAALFDLGTSRERGPKAYDPKGEGAACFAAVS
jgi:hypothetical protein